MKTQSKDIMKKYTDDETFDKIIDYSTVNEMWDHSAADFSDMPAICDSGITYTFSELDRDVRSFRTVIGNGVSDPSARIAILSENSYDFVKAYLAVVTSGHTAVILPAQLPDKAVFGCCMKYGAKALIFSPSLRASTETVESVGGISLIDITAKSEEDTPAADVSPETPCVIMLTGGTTGKSKGALLSHEAVMQGTVNGCYGYRDVFCQKYILVLPLSHVFGLIRNLMTSLYTGSALYICKNNKDMFRDIAQFRPTVWVAVPALAEMALSLSKKFGKNMLGEDMKYIICGAAPVAPYLVSEYSKLGITLFPGYGLTESANLVSGNPESLTRPESVGLMYPNQEYKVEDGELLLKGKNMLISYIGEEEPAYDADGWFRTGDLVRFDDDGFLYIVGRKKEVIVLPSGENISPAELEAEFNSVKYVQDSQVFEDVTENGNHILALEIVPRATEIASISAEDAEKIIRDCLNEVNEKLPSHARVQRIVIRTTDFDRTPSMKIVRYKKCN